MKAKLNLIPILLSCVAICLTSCSSSKPGSIPEVEQEKVDMGKYNTIYQIFPYSFADSNRDGIGDLKGIYDKLDYIADMGFTGIWITPVHESTTYHKYDVIDYYSIDSDFGTLDDYKALVDKAHDLGMIVIMDLVFNHTSNQNEWFKQSRTAQGKGDTSSQYYYYYNWYEEIPSGRSSNDFSYDSTAKKYYECPFWSGMPDLNWDYVFDQNFEAHLADGSPANLATELTDIMEFWLIDYGVDGFRLDATTSYYGNSNADTNDVKVLSWINEKAKAIKPDCYIVGEGSWGTSAYSNSSFYTSGIDSFFNFADAYSTGNIAKIFNQQNATTFADSINQDLTGASYTYTDSEGNQVTEQYVPAPFITNHDTTGRLVGASRGRENIDYLKFTYALESMWTGCIYHYYGDEIGMTVISPQDTDENKRIPLEWGDKYTCKPVSGTSEYSSSEAYPFGSVKKVMKSKDNSIDFISKCNKVRNAHPAITQGSAEMIYSSSDKTFSANIKTCDSEQVLVLINASWTSDYTYDYSESGFSTVVGQLAASSGTYIRQDDPNISELVLPPLSICVLAK
ncbi:MAG: hypothetical protein LUD22_04175 [Coprobacillus sp.]|nr:hypothetical protein [Coprobacillus sp.]